MRAVAAAVVLLLANPGQTCAHRLDEYLQAARVSLDRHRVTLEIDLTPGAAMAPAINALLDRDGDRTISPAEAEAYARVVLADVVLKLDDRTVSLTLTRVEVPALDEMRHGLGVIQVRATGDVNASAGRHYVRFRNDHRPEGAVYLINALLPADDDVRVVNQIRDARQREAQVEYHIGPYWPTHVAWIGFAAAGLSSFYFLLSTFYFHTPSAARTVRRYPDQYRPQYLSSRGRLGLLLCNRRNRN